MNPKVYLAGPITGLTYDQGQDWRIYAQDVLAEFGIDGFSPLRAKQFLKSEGVLSGSYGKHPLSSQRGIMTRDHNDVRTCDVVLANYEGTEKASRGTDMEFAWAYAYRKPLVVVAPFDGIVLDHPMVAEAVDYRLDTLDEALDVVRAILKAHA